MSFWRRFVFYSRLKKTLILGVIAFVIWLVVLLGLPGWLSSEAGEALSEAVLEQFKFLSTFVKSVKKIAGFSTELPDFGVQSTAISLLKALFSSMVKGILFCILSLLLSVVYGVAEAADLFRSLAWSAEDVLVYAGHKAWNALAAVISAVVSQLLVSYLLEWFEDWLTEYEGIRAAAVAVMVFVAFFLIYSVIVSFIEKREIEYGILRTSLIGIVPELISLFVIDLLLYAVYDAIIAGGFSARYVFIFILVLIWAGLEKNFKKILAMLFTKITGFKSKSGISLPNAIFLFCEVLLVTWMTYFCGALLFANPSNSGYSYLSKFPLLQGLIQGMPLESALIYGMNDVWNGLMVLLLAVLLISVILEKCPFKNIFLWLFVWVSITITAALYAGAGIRWLLLNYEWMMWVFLLIIILSVCRKFYVTLAAAASAVCTLVAYRALQGSGVMTYQSDFSEYLLQICIPFMIIMAGGMAVHFVRSRL